MLARRGNASLANHPPSFFSLTLSWSSLWHAQQGTGRMQSYGTRGGRKRFESYMKMTNSVTSNYSNSHNAVVGVARLKSFP
jgi:hypothetical protein